MLVSEEVPEPVPGPDQVLIDVDVANVTFVETQVRAGRPPSPSMLPRLPAILGNGVGGVVARVGDGVDPHFVGRRVVASLHGTGGYAERAVADSVALIDIPAALGTDEAVALLADGRTALTLIRAAEVGPGEIVLVEAAAGVVGSLLVQLAFRAGARVVGAAGGQRKLAVARELGASVVIDYTQAGWADRLTSEVGSLDVVFDGVGGSIGHTAFNLLGDDGRFCAFGMASGSFADVSEGYAKARQITRIPGGRPTAKDLRELARSALAEAGAGRLHAVIGQRFPLERAADGHAAIEQRVTVGKTLLLSQPTRPAGAEGVAS